MSACASVAMSGGVDSSVAAARLLDQGYDVVGVTLHLWDYPDDGSVRGRCCAPEDQYDARRVADHLGFPHYTFDRRELFREHVVEPFVDAYLDGETPSPCVACNRGVKLRELFALADRLGAALVATGHYARVVREDGRRAPRRGRDRGKDQSYFLYMLRARRARAAASSRSATPPRTRCAPRRWRAALPGADKGESQELCFVPAGRYDAFVAERAGGRLRPGPIVDARGPRRRAGTAGVHGFTIGQRKGLGVALGKPAFVVSNAKSSTKTAPIAWTMVCGWATLSDIDGLHALGSMPLVYRYLFDGAPPQRDFIAHRVARSLAHAAQPGFGMWFLEDAARRYAGCVELRPYPCPRTAELTYLLDPGHWGQGLAVRMAWTVIVRAFHASQADFVIAGADVPNRASVSVMHRLGMRFPGTGITRLARVSNMCCAATMPARR